MKIGYINKYDLERNPHLTNRFKYLEANATKSLTGRGLKVRCKLFSRTWDYDDVESNTKMLKGNPNMILVTEPFFVDDELRERITKWVDWANRADEKEYDPFI